MEPTEHATGPGRPRHQPLVPSEGQEVLPYRDLRAPAPVAPAPPVSARIVAVVAVVVGGLLGGLIGWGTTDLLTEGSVWPAVGGLAGSVMGAVGVGVIAGLTLQAMSEWRSVRHPEAE
jgi:hypothetical protein